MSDWDSLGAVNHDRTVRRARCWYWPRRLSVGGLACSTADTSPEAANAAVFRDAIIIDVRTPEEFAAGHLDGALLYNVQDPAFDATSAELDPSIPYVVYCRSGNRSAQAVERMAAAGFTNLVDLGSLENASAETGIAIVRELTPVNENSSNLDVMSASGDLAERITAALMKASTDVEAAPTWMLCDGSPTHIPGKGSVLVG